MKTFIVAMEKEAEPLLRQSEILSQEKVGFATCYEATYQGKPYHLVISGIGKGFAAAAAQIAALKYPSEEALINFGVAGSLDKGTAPLLGVVIANKLIEHDLDTSAIGDPKGLVSGLNVVDLPVDPDLKKALWIASQEEGQPTVLGTISSGDTFYADAFNKRRLHETFGSLAVDMEGAPIAQIALANQVRFAALRVISDADNSGEEYATNAKKAAAIACGIIGRFLLD